MLSPPKEERRDLRGGANQYMHNVLRNCRKYHATEQIGSPMRCVAVGVGTNGTNTLHAGRDSYTWVDIVPKRMPA